MPSLSSQAQTMLSISPPQVHRPHVYITQPGPLTSDSPSSPSSSITNTQQGSFLTMPHRLPDPASLVAGVPSSSPAFALKMASSSQPIMSDVSQALEIARESPDGASDPTIHKILDQAVSYIWGKIQAQPNDYVMTRDEFSVFNYFQHRFTGDKTAIAARARYWNNTKA